jgi:hypothetical protein
MTVGRAGSPCGLGMDHSLGRDAGEAPEPLRSARDWPGGFSAIVLFPLRSLAEQRGMRGPLSSHLDLIMARLIFEETI